MDKKPRLIIVDPEAPMPYTPSDLKEHALGGTESTVLKICSALRPYFSISIMQKDLDIEFIEDGMHFLPFNHKDLNRLKDAENIIVVRNEKVIPCIRKQNKSARIFLWLHCFPGKSKRNIGEICTETESRIICVSETQKRFVKKLCQDEILEEKINVIYNPIDDSLSPNEIPHNPDKLLFLSSPHKGLDEVIENFNYVSKEIPSLELYIANPGYINCKMSINNPQIKYLGSLTHPQVIEHLRNSLCLFYPQNSFAETFGLVYAEANAVGTPVLAYPIGAAEEIIGDKRQILDPYNRFQLTHRIYMWRTYGRPQIHANREYYLSNVLDKWKRLLEVSKGNYDRSTTIGTTLQPQNLVS